VSHEVFTDPDFADDVSIMEMLEVIIFTYVKNLPNWDSKSIGTRPRYKALNHFRVPLQWSQSLAIKWRW